MVLEGVIDGAKSALVRRSGEMVGELVFDRARGMIGAPSSDPGFSTGATAFIAITSAAVGGLVGWALHDFFKKGNR